jgi:hypothetical protein
VLKNVVEVNPLEGAEDAAPLDDDEETAVEDSSNVVPVGTLIQWDVLYRALRVDRHARPTPVMPSVTRAVVYCQRQERAGR